MNRRLLIAAAVTAVAGCALTFSPGDYGGGAIDGGAASPVDGGTIDTGVVGTDGAVTPPIDAGPLAPALHVLVIAGEREGADSATSDVWSAPIDASGEVGAFTYLPSGPVRGPRFAATIADGRLLVVTKTNADRVVESAAFDGGPQLSWQTSLVATPTAPGFGQFFARASLVAAGGSVNKLETTYVGDFFVSAPSGGVYPRSLTTFAAKLPVGLHNVSVVTSKSIVFFWGDGADPSQRAKLYSGKIDPATGATDVAERGLITDPQAGKTHTPATPIACAGEGHLFIAGGDTDVVLTAAIDETTGAVGAWKAGPKLPAVLRGAGCAVWNGEVHILGGATGGTAGTVMVRSDKILSATVAPDGTMGPWVTSPRTLLGPRSNVFVLTY